MPNELYRRSGSGRYEGVDKEKKPFKRPVKGQKGTPPKKDSGDYSAPKKKKPKPTNPIKGWGGSGY